MLSSEYVPDIHERGEARVERYCLPDGKVQCAGCEAAIDPMDAHAVSPDPYAAPLCDVCLQKWIKDHTPAPEASDEP